MIVLDASAALAYLLKEPGGNLVRQNLASSIITTVNLIEVYRRLRRGLSQKQVEAVSVAFEAKLSRVEAVALDDVPEAYRIYADFQKSHGVSLGDSVCLAVGMRLNLEVWTTDTTWVSLANVGQVKVIR
ncbi:MAG: PIN domain-containing protein [Rhodomicrobium sp.]